MPEDMKVLTWFWIPYFIAVTAATVAFWLWSNLSEFFNPNPKYSWLFEPFFLMIWCFIAVIAVLPACLSVLASNSRKRPFHPLVFGVLGALTAAVSTLATPLVSSGFDALNPWLWTAVFYNVALIPMFAIPGLIAGYCFGVLRERFQKA